MKGEEQLSVVCIKVVVERNGRDESAEGSGVHDEEQRTKNRALLICCASTMVENTNTVHIFYVNIMNYTFFSALHCCLGTNKCIGM